jgi:hypothetical protein
LTFGAHYLQLCHDSSHISYLLQALQKSIGTNVL